MSPSPAIRALSAAPIQKKIRAVSLTEVAYEEVKWLWYPYIPAGKVTLLEGDFGMGKSWLTCSLAADLSVGRALPGMKEPLPPQKVLMVSAEDGLGDTIKPRMTVLGADMARIFVSDDSFILDAAGIKAFTAIMREVAATIVFLDPLVAYLGGKMDMHRANETRAMMGPLAQAAKETGCAVVVVRHFRKGTEGKAIHRGVGSVDFGAAVRSIVQVDEDKGGTRFMSHVKSNNAPLGPAIGYSIEDNGFRWGDMMEKVPQRNGTDGDHNRAPKVSTRPRQKAEAFLRDALGAGPVPTRELLRLAADNGFAERTLMRAKPGLARSERNSNGDWYWELEPGQGTGTTEGTTSGDQPAPLPVVPQPEPEGLDPAVLREALAKLKGRSA